MGKARAARTLAAPLLLLGFSGVAAGTAAALLGGSALLSGPVLEAAREDPALLTGAAAAYTQLPRQLAAGLAGAAAGVCLLLLALERGREELERVTAATEVTMFLQPNDNRVTLSRRDLDALRELALTEELYLQVDVDRVFGPLFLLEDETGEPVLGLWLDEEAGICYQVYDQGGHVLVSALEGCEDFAPGGAYQVRFAPGWSADAFAGGEPVCLMDQGLMEVLGLSWGDTVQVGVQWSFFQA